MEPMPVILSVPVQDVQMNDHEETAKNFISNINSYTIDKAVELLIYELGHAFHDGYLTRVREEYVYRTKKHRGRF